MAGRTVGGPAIFDFCTRLADAFLAGPWRAEDLCRRAEDLLGQPDPWLAGLVARVLAAHPRPEGLQAARLQAFLLADRGLRVVYPRRLARLTLRRYFLPAPVMAGPRLPTLQALPPWASPGELAAGLGLGPATLAGLADEGDWHLSARPTLQNYRRRWVTPRGPVGSPRLLEAPKDRLRRAQRHILRQILDHVPVHPAAHGFVKGGSVTACAAVHAGQDLLIRVDLLGFFPSIRRRRVAGLFRALGYPERVAHTLACLCTTSTPRRVRASIPTEDAVARRFAEWAYGDRHLPQGAPSSPALANLCAYRLDARLAGLARAVGARYTRYADDLFVSGPRGLGARRLVARVAKVVAEEGLHVHHAKTRIVGPGGAHRCLGLVVNAHPAVPRREREQLEAILVNCARTGPAAQNRDGHPDFRAHLLGRVAWVAAAHPRHGDALRGLFGAVDWGA